MSRPQQWRMSLLAFVTPGLLRALGVHAVTVTAPLKHQHDCVWWHVFFLCTIANSTMRRAAQSPQPLSGVRAGTDKTV